MRKILLFPIAFIMSFSFTATQAQINMLAIDWHNFNGAKSIQTAMQGPNNGSSFKVTLDGKGNVLNEEYIYKGELFSKTTFVYDNEGRVIERKKTSNMDSKAPRSFIYTYHYTDNKCDEQRMSGDGEVYERIVSVLNAKGLKTSEIHYGKDGSEEEKYEFGYDSRGNQTFIKCVDPHKDVILHDMSPVTIINRLTYDEHNNPTSLEISYGTAPATSTQKMSYIYDAHGNWTKRTMTFDNKSGKVDMQSSEMIIEY